MYMTYLFFFNDTATTEIYTLSLHDALPICYVLRITESIGDTERDLEKIAAGNELVAALKKDQPEIWRVLLNIEDQIMRDRKSTRLNSSHANISYAVLCLKTNLTQVMLVSVR